MYREEHQLTNKRTEIKMKETNIYVDSTLHR